MKVDDCIMAHEVVAHFDDAECDEISEGDIGQELDIGEKVYGGYNFYDRIIEDSSSKLSDGQMHSRNISYQIEND